MKYLFIIFLFYSNTTFSQTSKVETVVAFGVGNNQNDALYNAKLNALDQIFGTFISTTTTIMNDSITMNKVVSITNGQITNYDILKSEKIDNGYIVTIKAFANLQKLVSFCNSIGIEARIQGNIYSETRN